MTTAPILSAEDLAMLREASGSVVIADKLIATIDALRAERDALKARAERYREALRPLYAERDEARAKLERLEAKVYAPNCPDENCDHEMEHHSHEGAGCNVHVMTPTGWFRCTCLRTSATASQVKEDRTMSAAGEPEAPTQTRENTVCCPHFRAALPPNGRLTDFGWVCPECTP